MTKPDSSMFKLDPAPKMITFDCYGTLVQWYEVLLSEIEKTLAAQNRNGASALAVLDSFSSQGRHLTAQRPHRLYKDILRIGFTSAFREHGATPSADDIERLASSPMRMGPHPEVPAAFASATNSPSSRTPTTILSRQQLQLSACPSITS